MSKATAPSAPTRRFFNWRPATYGWPVWGSRTVASAVVSAASEMVMEAAPGGATEAGMAPVLQLSPAGRRIEGSAREAHAAKFIARPLATPGTGTAGRAGVPDHGGPHGALPAHESAAPHPHRQPAALQHPR